jgi:hypothetical protein
MYSKTLVSNPLLTVVASESAGVLSLTQTSSISVGGGEAAGVVTLDSSNTIKMSVKQLVDLAAELGEKAVPALAPEIAIADSAVDAELGKL